MDNSSKQTPPDAPTQPSRRSGRTILIALAGLLGLYAVARPASLQAAWAELTRLIELKSEPLPASPPRLSEHVLEEIEQMPPQQQAQALMQRVVNHYEGSIELVNQHLDRWRGHLEVTPELTALLSTAINSNDLRVRAATIEVYLAAYNVPKTPEAAKALVQRMERDPQSRPWGLWMLGGLANRGVEPELAFNTLVSYTREPDEETRHWAVEGLSLVGSDATIQPLLGIFRDDPSMKVRERAACGLAQSGMLTREQRLTAVPTFLNYAEDPALDATTRRWVFQALRDITGADLGSDVSAWRAWWMEHAPR